MVSKYLILFCDRQKSTILVSISIIEYHPNEMISPLWKHIEASRATICEWTDRRASYFDLRVFNWFHEIVQIHCCSCSDQFQIVTMFKFMFRELFLYVCVVGRLELWSAIEYAVKRAFNDTRHLIRSSQVHSSAFFTTLGLQFLCGLALKIYNQIEKIGDDANKWRTKWKLWSITFMLLNIDVRFNTWSFNASKTSTDSIHRIRTSHRGRGKAFEE